MTKQTFKAANLLGKVIYLRFVIAAIAFCLIVFFKLNSSSITMWDGIVRERTDGRETDILLGEERPIRQDEWKVQTPFYLAQDKMGFPVNNPTFSPDGQNMILAYHSPVLDPVILGKPFNWGFVLFGRDYGLAWYWGFKLIGMLLLAFELIMILTKKNKALSLLGAFWITFSPAVQWWFMQHVGDLIFFTLAILVAVYHYFAAHSSHWKRIAMVVLGASSVIGFILVIYPAFQVTLGYLLLFMFIAYFIYFKDKVRLDKFDILYIGGALAVIFTILFHFFFISREALAATMNTVYPGHRVSLGGGNDLELFSAFLTNWRIPFKDVSYSNNCEVSNFFHFFPVVLLFSPWLFYKKIKENIFGFMLFLYCLLCLVWGYVSFPKFIAKITLLSYVPSVRLRLAFGFGSLLLSLWFIDYFWRQSAFSAKIKGAAAGLTMLLYIATIHLTKMQTYFKAESYWQTLLGAAILLACLLWKKQKIFILCMGFLIAIAGFTVNPIIQGTGAIYEKKLSREVMAIEARDPGKLWLAENDLYNFLPALGVHTFNTVDFYPDLKTWRRLDKQKKYEQIYNRYAHVTADLVAEKAPPFVLMHADAFRVNVPADQLQPLKISYIVTQKDLAYFPSEQTFIPLYGPDQDNYRIYQIANTSN